ncbi:MAG TPA: carboxypeptidase-like regulatory domain-containing protein [Ignavibacteria bacterium]|jgi:hypothetical protein
MKTSVFQKLCFSFLILNIFLLILSCNEDTPEKTNNPLPPPSGITLNGFVLDENAAPVIGIKVSVSSKQTYTSYDGSFTLSNIITPYDIKITFVGVPKSVGVVYKGMTTPGPLLLMQSYPGSGYSATLSVRIPPLSELQRATIIFTDNYTEGSAVIRPPADTANISIKWGEGSSITGKVIVYIYPLINGIATDYQKYGAKQNIILTNGGNTSIIFNENELTTNPGEASISGSLLGGVIGQGTTFAITYRFGALLYPFKYGAPISTTFGNEFTFVVPTYLPLVYNYVLSGFTYGPDSGMFSSKCRTVEFNTNNLIALESMPTLESPPDNAVNVDQATQFGVNPGTGTGINLISFEAPDRVFHVYQTEKFLNLPSFEIGIGRNTAYTWYVRRLGSLEDINQFGYSYFYNDNRLTFFTSSAKRRFTTKP